MKGEADLLFPKAIHYKKREGLGSPKWRFNTHPSVLLTEYLNIEIMQEYSVIVKPHPQAIFPCWEDSVFIYRKKYKSDELQP